MKPSTHFDSAEQQVRRAIDTLDLPRDSMREQILARVAERVPADLRAAYELVWMRRVSGIAAAIFLALFAADRFDVGEPTFSAGSTSTSTSTSMSAEDQPVLPAWAALEQGRQQASADRDWWVAELLIGGVDE